MEVVAVLRELKKTNEDEGKHITYISSLELKDIYSSKIKRNTACEGKSISSTIH